MSIASDTDIQEMRDLLGLCEDDTLDIVADVALPKPETERGFVSEQLWQEVEQVQFVEPIALGLHVNLSAWERESGVFRLKLNAGDALHSLEGTSRQVSPDEWWIDARASRARIGIELTTGQEAIILLDPGRAQAATSVRLPQTPTMQELCAAGYLEPWLESLVQESASSPSALDRAAAVGYVLRHCGLGKVGGALTEMVELGEKRRRAANAWASSLGETPRKHLLREALDSAESLLTDLLELDQGDGLTDAELGAIVENVSVERERLACILEVFGEQAERLKHAVEELDKEAHHHRPNLFGVEVHHPLLSAVAQQAPDAWWGRQ